MISSIKNGFMTNQMKQTEGLVSKYQKQLTTGKKVNNAADDAAALSISSKMLSQIGSYKQTSSNITSQISANRIAEGALSGINDSYNDMYGNSIRAMNGLMSDSDKAAIGEVNDSLKAGVAQVASTTKYNENFLLDDEVDTDFDSLDASAISSASSDIAAQRSKLGATENGLEYEQAANDIAAENLEAANSRKVDAEMEKAISAYQANATVNKFQYALLGQQLQDENGVTRLFE